ncbi:MAG: CLI_3235 family bacteriocin precursor [Caldicoprobacteraceae bacterium]
MKKLNKDSSFLKNSVEAYLCGSCSNCKCLSSCNCSGSTNEHGDYSKQFLNIAQYNSYDVRGPY